MKYIRIARSRQSVIAGIVLIASALNAWTAEPPPPFGATPSARQLRWQELEFNGFLHFTVNTFTDKEWGDGDEDEKLFNPSDFDAEQIARTARDAGMKGLILTAKHHDGFCLWPSKFTEHSVKNSAWKDGHGDVVKEISDACRKCDLRFGVYLSPWDRNHKDYGQPEYIAFFRNQLRELLTQYGPIFEVWFDGANGGEGYYGGAREARMIDRQTYYDWPATWQLVRELQPEACIFSDVGPDVLWVGNERGTAGNPCWCTLTPGKAVPGASADLHLNRGDRDGAQWLPAECDVSIRKGWFYHEQEKAMVKTPRQLLALYFASVGRGATLLLNLPPDRRGQIADSDVESLREFRGALDAIFTKNIARDAMAVASNTRGNDSKFGAATVLDDRRDTYWSTDDDVTQPELIVDLGQPATFNVVRLREYLPLGQRIESFALDQWHADQWMEFARGSSIGNCRLVRGEEVTASKVRLRITKSAACVALSELSLFREEP